jgi:hypothetical protein
MATSENAAALTAWLGDTTFVGGPPPADSLAARIRGLIADYERAEQHAAGTPTLPPLDRPCTSCEGHGGVIIPAWAEWHEAATAARAAFDDKHNGPPVTSRLRGTSPSSTRHSWTSCRPVPRRQPARRAAAPAGYPPATAAPSSTS